MRSWIRITSVIFVLIGGAIFFGHWSLVQFDYIFDDLSGFYVANIVSVIPRINKSDGQIGTTSPEISTFSVATDTESIATTSLDVLVSLSPVTIDDDQAPSPSLEVFETLATTTGLDFSLIFPEEDDDIYIGCTYQVAWQASAGVDSLGTVLVDAGTGEVAGPVASGLAREHKIESAFQHLNWKVGIVWPGEYYIKVSNVNNLEKEFRSKVFEINRMSTNISIDEQESICKGSGGSL